MPTSIQNSIHSTVLILTALFFTSTLAAQPARSNDEQSAATLKPNDVLRGMALTSQAFRVAAEKIQPALVTIESYGGAGTKKGKIGGIRSKGEGNTTGVMISSDGYVLTSTFNIVEQPLFFSVIPSDGKRRFAKVIGRDDTRKLCLLKLEPGEGEAIQDMPVPDMLPIDQIKVGQWALSLGVGYGDSTPAMSMGIISATNRIGGRAVQTDANISPANYGGPLIDIEGRMIGICVPMNPQSQAIGAGVEWYDSGIGFAVPLAGAERLIQRLKDGEQISPAYLGVQLVPNPAGPGLVIEKVVPKTPAADAGLKPKDIVLKINGESVEDMLKVRQILNRFEAGQNVEIESRKKGILKPRKFKIKLGVAPKPKSELDQLEPPTIR